MTPSFPYIGIVAGLAVAARFAVQGADGVHVCIAADRVLRHQPSGACPRGATEFYLAEVERKIETNNERAQAGDPEAADLQRRLLALTQRVAKLEGSAASGSNQLSDRVADMQRRYDLLVQRIAALEAGGGTTGGKGERTASRVTAPFEVVDGSGKPIFVVRAEPRGYVLFSTAGEGMVYSSAVPTGGFVKTRSSDGSLETVMGINGRFASFFVRQSGKTRANMSLSENGKPSFELSNDAGVNVAVLTPGGSGGGYLQLGDASGNSMVEAGVTAQGVGLVRTYPLGNASAGLVGMPGTFIIGRSR